MEKGHPEHMHAEHRHEVVCIEANKVFDLCFQEHRAERLFTVSDINEQCPVTVECEIDQQNITCREVSPRKKIDGKKNKFLICVAIEVPVRIRIMNQNTGTCIQPINQRLVILKQVVLCAPEGTIIRCEVTGNCCCFFDANNNQVNCVFNFCIVIKSTATVNILVPTLGVCVPAPCQSVTTGCPPSIPNVCERDCDP